MRIARRGRALAVLLAAVCASCAGPALRRPATGKDGPLHSRAEVRGAYGLVHGSVEVPKGGNGGSTTPDRPSLKEMGIRRSTTTDARVRGGNGTDEVSLEVRNTSLDGDGRIDPGLVTRGISFPAGTRVDGHIDLGSLWLGYGRRFLLGDAEEPSAALVPEGGFAFWQFRYRLHSERRTLSADRGYGHGVPFVGARVEAEAGGRWDLAVGARATLPVLKEPVVVTPVEAEAACRLWRSPGSEGALVLGLFYEGDFFHDRQKTPNQVRIVVGPSVSLGFRVDF